MGRVQASANSFCDRFTAIWHLQHLDLQPPLTGFPQLTQGGSAEYLGHQRLGDQAAAPAPSLEGLDLLQA